MITPNKAISIQESALGLVPVIMARGPEPTDLLTLYHSVADQFESADQFILALDILYVLRRVDVDFATRLVTYVG
jgi:hypothetical protein